MHSSAEYCKVHDYDANLRLTENSLKQLYRRVNQTLSLICHWLRANQISLKIGKIETIIFQLVTRILAFQMVIAAFHDLCMQG